MSRTMADLLDAGTVARATTAEQKHPQTARILAREITRAAQAHPHADDVATVALLHGLAMLGHAAHADDDRAAATLAARRIARAACAQVAPAVISDHVRAGRTDVPADGVEPVESTDAEETAQVLLSLPTGQVEAAPDTITRWTHRDTLAAVLDTTDAPLTVRAVTLPRAGTRGADTLTARLAAADGLKAGRATTRLRDGLAAEQEALSAAGTTVLRWLSDRDRVTRRYWTDDAATLAQELLPEIGSDGVPAGKGHRPQADTLAGEIIVRDLGEAIVLQSADGSWSLPCLPFEPSTGRAITTALDSAHCTHSMRRTDSMRDADNFAARQEPMGAVAKPNTRKSKKGGRVGTSTIPVGARR